jgi:hypothetical protein
MTNQAIAEGCYEANRLYCKSIGDNSLQVWEKAEAWQKMSVLNGVEFHQANPETTASDSHENWVKDKLADGWKWGAKKDVAKKQHPCLQSFNKLSAEQQRKDMIFLAVAKHLSAVKSVASVNDKVLLGIIAKVSSEKIVVAKAPKEVKVPKAKAPKVAAKKKSAKTTSKKTTKKK